MKRGEVFVAELRPRSGSEQRWTRPVIVVSHDAFNDVVGWRSVIVAVALLAVGVVLYGRPEADIWMVTLDEEPQ